MLSIKVIDEANKEDYPMHFAYNEKRKSATLSFAGRYSIVDMVNTIDDLLSLMSAKVQIAMEGSNRRADEATHPAWRVDLCGGSTDEDTQMRIDFRHRFGNPILTT